MRTSHVEVLVEEPSMERVLTLLLPKLLGSTTFEIYVHQGKHHLLRKLPQRLAAYAKSLPEDWRVLVVVDRDSQQCDVLKKEIDDCAAKAGLVPRSRAKKSGPRWQLVSRIAIEELEAWYFGDWEAVCAAYPKVKSTVVKQASYRKPDEIRGGTWEAFERELKKHGYFLGGLRKMEAASTIAAHMEPTRNCSPSFQRLVEVLEELATPP